MAFIFFLMFQKVLSKAATPTHTEQSAINRSESLRGEHGTLATFKGGARE